MSVHLHIPGLTVSVFACDKNVSYMCMHLCVCVSMSGLFWCLSVCVSMSLYGYVCIGLVLSPTTTKHTVSSPLGCDREIWITFEMR